MQGAEQGRARMRRPPSPTPPTSPPRSRPRYTSRGDRAHACLVAACSFPWPMGRPHARHAWSSRENIMVAPRFSIQAEARDLADRLIESSWAGRRGCPACSRQACRCRRRRPPSTGTAPTSCRAPPPLCRTWRPADPSLFVGGRHLRMLTARAATSAMVSREMSDWAAIKALAHGVSGGVSVGLNAVALVNDT